MKRQYCGLPVKVSRKKVANPPIPDEVLLEIFYRMDTDTLAEISVTSKKFRAITGDLQFKKEYLTRRLGEGYDPKASAVQAIKNSQIGLLDLLLLVDEQSLTPISLVDEIIVDAVPAVVYAARRGDHKTLLVLLDHDANPSVQDDAAIIRSAALGQNGSIKILLNAGANINARDDAALIEAVENGMERTALLLLKHGATHWAGDDIPLISGADLGMTDLVEYILEKNHTIPTSNLTLALFNAIEKHHNRIVDMLVGTGFRIELEEDPNVLVRASELGNLHAVKRVRASIISHGQYEYMLRNMIDDAIDAAVVYDHPAVADYLIDDVLEYEARLDKYS